MIPMAIRIGFVLALALGAIRPAVAQESKFASDLRREGEHIAENCTEMSLGKVASCAVTLATDYPFHIALGSLAPDNGFGFGLAFVERYTPSEFWRLNWSADAVRTPYGSWRAGAYMKVIHTPDQPIVVAAPGDSEDSGLAVREFAVLNVHAQTIALNTLFFSGIGPSTTGADRSAYSERQTIVGTSAVWPVPASGWLQRLRPSLVGGLNGRFIRIRGNRDEGVPAIDDLYDGATAPGVNDDSSFLQLEEGVRLRPSVARGRVRMNYLVNFEQFFGGDAGASFDRWTVDLKHEIPIYRTVASPAISDTNGPNECFMGVGSTACPPISYSRNRSGAIGLRLLTTSSSAFSGSRVPFYFQPTLGGSDINGQRLLASLDDYRFRGPRLIVLQESIEHSLWGPLGIYVQADQGKVVEEGGSLDLSDLEHSFTVGLTVRAGGLPMMSFSFAWGSGGQHMIGSMNTSLLGGSSRPSLH